MSLRALFLAILLAFSAPVAVATDEKPPVDTALVLAIDFSESISAEEFALQIKGYSAAFRSERVRTAIFGGPIGAVAVAIVHWCDAAEQWGEWRYVSNEAEAESLARLLDDMHYSLICRGTSTASALALGHHLLKLENLPVTATKRVIDVSGDGAENCRSATSRVRDRTVASGIVINGLAIIDKDPYVVAHYEEEVIGGPGSFLVVAADFRHFAEAIIRKLLLELASRSAGTSG